jgi:hypothetical protein
MASRINNRAQKLPPISELTKLTIEGGGRQITMHYGHDHKFVIVQLPKQAKRGRR